MRISRSQENGSRGFARASSVRVWAASPHPSLAATNRAVLLAGGHLGSDQRHTYELPQPLSLKTKAEWHRFTITLSYLAPTIAYLNRYRQAKVYFATPDMQLAGGKREQAEHTMVQRGSLQHEILEGKQAMAFQEGGAFPIPSSGWTMLSILPPGSRFDPPSLCLSKRQKKTSTTIHDEVRLGLGEQARVSGRLRSQ